MQENDDEVPDCETEVGCKIPALSRSEGRIMNMYTELRAAKELIPPEIILSAHGATYEDIKLLLAVNRESINIEREKD